MEQSLQGPRGQCGQKRRPPASVGAAFARIESRGAHTLLVTTELIGGSWYGVLYHRGAPPAPLTVDEIANRLWVSTPCAHETTAWE